MDKKNIVKELVETEMSEGSHLDYVEDYNTPEEFYLSNVEKDSYIEYIMNSYNINSENLAYEIQAEVIDTIKEKCR